MAFENLPEELKLYNSWVVWRYEDVGKSKPTKVPYCPVTEERASSTDSSTWVDFATCVNALIGGRFDGLGFVLSDNDPFAVIDLDDPEEDAKTAEFQKQIFETFQTYSEISPSGNGLHIILKGSIPKGRRRGKIELYSNERFITMTGNVVDNLPIADCNSDLNSLYGYLGRDKSANVIVSMGLAEPEFSDDEIMEKAYRAANGDKFVELWEGRWVGAYGSQSEADFALMDILGFYSKNRQQIVRLFRQSALGQRDKAQRKDYIGSMLNRVFDNQTPEIDFEGLREKIERQLEHRVEPERIEPEASKPFESSIPVPQGLVGQLAEFFYEQATRQVPEIAIAAAIGLMAGICGRAYNISGTGLNQYILTLAATGAGKESLSNGIDKIMGAVCERLPGAVLFIGPSEIASAQALGKYMARTSSSFVSVTGEFGLYLQQMSAKHAPAHLAGLRRSLLDLYNKSGEGRVVRESIYSDKDKNTKPIISPAFTLLGESTPEKFYEGLHEGMLTEGLLPRFTIIEYSGERKLLNKNHANVQPSYEIINKVAEICANCLSLNTQNKVVHIGYEGNAEAILDEYEVFTTGKINESNGEIKRHFWNRAHMKALKLAGVIAVGVNPYNPAVSEEAALWAIRLTNSDVENMLHKFETGEILSDYDEQAQLKKVFECVVEFCKSSYAEVSKYLPEGYEKFHQEKVIPYSYLQRRLAGLKLFKQERGTSAGAIKMALKTLCDRGDIQEVGKATLTKEFGSAALAFVLKDISSLK